MLIVVNESKVVDCGADAAAWRDLPDTVYKNNAFGAPCCAGVVLITPPCERGKSARCSERTPAVISPGTKLMRNPRLYVFWPCVHRSDAARCGLSVLSRVHMARYSGWLVRKSNCVCRRSNPPPPRLIRPFPVRGLPAILSDAPQKNILVMAILQQTIVYNMRSTRSLPRER